MEYACFPIAVAASVRMYYEAFSARLLSANETRGEREREKAIYDSHVGVSGGKRVRHARFSCPGGRGLSPRRSEVDPHRCNVRLRAWKVRRRVREHAAKERKAAKQFIVFLSNLFILIQ